MLLRCAKAVFPAAFLLAFARTASARPFAFEGAHSLWEWIEDNGAIVYPAIALAIVGLIAGALLSSWRADELNAEQRGQLKMKILQIMRRRLSGVSPEMVAAELQLDVIIAARLLGELEEEGVLASSPGRSTTPVQYRLRGGH